MNRNTCCFFGHRKIDITNELKERLCKVIKKLIIEKNTEIFLFGSKSQFNDLCYRIVTDLKADFPNIKRIYVRAQFPYISNEYELYLLHDYEETYFPINIYNAGKLVYVERNFEMIDKSKFCVIYYDENYTPPRRKKFRFNGFSSQKWYKNRLQLCIKKTKDNYKYIFN